MNTFQPSPPVDASDTRRGFWNTLTQLIAGAKTFLGAVVMSAGLTLNSVNRLLQVAPPNTVSGQSYTDPAFEIRTSALNQTHLFQIGSGLTNSTWELAIGWYGSALCPVISSRSASILFNMATGTSLSCFTPGNADLGSSSNYWRNLFMGSQFSIQTNLSSVQIAAANKPIFFYAAGGSGITETIRLVNQRADSGLKSVVVGTESTTPNANAVLFQVAHSITTVANDAANGTGLFKVYGLGNVSIPTGAALFFNGALSVGPYLYSDTASRLRLGLSNADAVVFDASNVAIKGARAVSFETFPDISGTPGSGTINAAKGRARLDAATTTITITNDKVTANSVIVIQPEDDQFPPMGGGYYVTCAAGSFTINWGVHGSGYNGIFRFVVFS